MKSLSEVEFAKCFKRLGGTMLLYKCIEPNHVVGVGDIIMRNEDLGSVLFSHFREGALSLQKTGYFKITKKPFSFKNLYEKLNS